MGATVVLAMVPARLPRRRPLLQRTGSRFHRWLCLASAHLRRYDDQQHRRWGQLPRQRLNIPRGEDLLENGAPTWAMTVAREVNHLGKSA